MNAHAGWNEVMFLKRCTPTNLLPHAHTPDDTHAHSNIHAHAHTHRKTNKLTE